MSNFIINPYIFAVSADIDNFRSLSKSITTGMSNSIRGLYSGGGTPDASTSVNSIDKITIQSTGNAVDFGDYIGTAVTQAAGCSDSHGGLS